MGLAFYVVADRCGVVDNEGNEILADKMGATLARDFSAADANAHSVVDAKRPACSEPTGAAGEWRTHGLLETGHS